jgi:hypothetical protein
MIDKAFLEYYRCPQEFADFQSDTGLDEAARKRYFTFGGDVTCYGAVSLEGDGEAFPDAMGCVRSEGSTWRLAFSPTEAAANLRFERYVSRDPQPLWKRATRTLYYGLRPGLPVSFRRHLQRRWLRGWEDKPFPHWPVDRSVDQMFEKLMTLRLQMTGSQRVPFVWFWPDGKQSCSIMTHDVETAAGLNFCRELMNIDDSFGIKSSFQLIPEARYNATDEVRSSIWERGFEVNVHDLKHDGCLFADRETFMQAATRVNEHAKRFGSRGFRSGALYRNVEWFGAFTFSYDMSVPNVGHLDPQPGGCCTVMPFFVGGILELPVTTVQDYTLFHILNLNSCALWRRQIDHIQEHHGLISVIVHPDYLDSRQARSTYAELLMYLARIQEEAGLWTALPGDVDKWWRQRDAMALVSSGIGWRIEGAGCERARLAYATTNNGRLEYQLAA